MVMMPVLDKNGKKKNQLEFSDEVFGKAVNQDVIHQAVVMYRASLRQGTVATKDFSLVHGGGKKPYRQKGTGRARQGSIRAPQFVGGATVFGPQPRDFGYSVPKKIRRAALRESINAKIKAEQIILVDDFKDKFTKT
ncbi:MAG TPA: 50S ribosomal protein L4, partial [Candidatus Omnitrophota bacterium]|nr:50S ribosomal protein L4 [Candidatus Omnitrophota bacterium]